MTAARSLSSSYWSSSPLLQYWPVGMVTGVAMALGYVDIPKVFWNDKQQHRKGGNVAMGDGRALQVNAKATKTLLYASDDDPAGSFNNHILKPR